MNAPSRVAVFLALAGLLVALAPALAGEDETVLISRPGTVFHKSGATDMRGRGLERSLSQVLASGYTPCPVCFAKSTQANLRVGTPGAAASPATGEALVISRGQRGGSTYAQPNGVQVGRVNAPGSSERGGIPNPFEQVSKIINPGKEEGAYQSGYVKEGSVTQP
jgi:hypothetical protein